MAKDNIKRIRIQEREPIQIHPEAEVTLIRQGRYYAEVMYMARLAVARVRKLNKDEYVVLSTGEIKNYESSTGKQQEALRRTFQELRYVIRTNFSSTDKYQKFITLTYVENMTDKDRLYVDFKAFIKRLQRHCKAHPLVYIVVAEPQERGAWHMHLMLKSTEPGLWIDKDKLTKIWRHGYTEIEQLKGDDCANYYTAYFTSISLEAREFTNAVAKPETGSKAYVKGGRLGYYPKGFKFYRCSQNIERPTREQIEYWRTLDEFGKPKKKKAHELLKEFEAEAEAKGVNFIQRESFKKANKEG